ncbi:putative phosphoesterase, PA-phosphatase related protein [Mycolicibacterium parafortuitum]|uniref:Putative phosphoesterase, PA-phosphatase related protein n=1 Tax=Mycolicibacterium parafortuitum TaxID=39692 RepID=A0A7I7U0W6_MYCPF|nr:phosphatase PAP2 family protein [Mycolicibacterium parafortuitum]BBY74026.1 putative phosphoesterase, PA-phosphatase related protein [Mycolicibacterium parafortuitum]
MRANGKALVASAVVAVALYVLLWVGWMQGWAWLERLDSAALEPAHRYGVDHPGWVTGWDLFCTVLSPGAFRIAALVLIIVALLRRRVRFAMFLVVTIELSALLTEIAKSLADRARPDTAFVDAWGTSFPSGHAVGVMVAVIALLVIALPSVDPAKRGWLIALGVAVVLLIGAGRVVLNVHHPSDVVAGWALGYAYVVACWLLLPPRPPVTRPDGTPAALDTAR